MARRPCGGWWGREPTCCSRGLWERYVDPELDAERRERLLETGKRPLVVDAEQPVDGLAVPAEAAHQFGAGELLSPQRHVQGGLQIVDGRQGDEWRLHRRRRQRRGN